MSFNMRGSALLLVVALSTVLFGAGCSGSADDVPRFEWVDSETTMAFVLIEPGSFVMGTPPDEADREAQERQHRVTLSKPFYLGRYEVTQGQWTQVMGSNPSHFQDCGPDCPVENVNYLQIQELARRLSKSSGKLMRLPTEAEWEYACRAGAQTAFSTGSTLTIEDANFDDRSSDGSATPTTFYGGPRPVGVYAPNPWGLHDLHGNVWEWCEDWHCPYPDGPVTDPLGQCESEVRVIRGGSWHYGADSARCGLRYTHRPEDLGPSLGFRLAFDADTAQQ